MSLDKMIEEKEEKKASTSMFGDSEPVATTKKQPAKQKPKTATTTKKETKTTQNEKQFIPSFIMIFNGRQGSGKSSMADLFPTPFIIDLEHGKNIDMLKYSSYEQIRNLRIGTMEDIKNNETEIDIIDTQEKDWSKTWENVKKIVKWYIKIGHKNHQTLIIDTALWLRKSRVSVEMDLQGKQKLDWYEYSPVTKDNQELIYDLFRDIRELKRNLILITHWMPKYKTFKNEKGHPESHVIGEIPDVKDWLLDAVTWRIDFLKPEDSGFSDRFIVYLDKSPRYQYANLDITNKSLFDIINDLDTFKKEVETFKELTEEKQKGDMFKEQE